MTRERDDFVELYDTVHCIYQKRLGERRKGSWDSLGIAQHLIRVDWSSGEYFLCSVHLGFGNLTEFRFGIYHISLYTIALFFKVFARIYRAHRGTGW